MKEMCSKVYVSYHFISTSRPLAIASVTRGKSISSFSTPSSSSLIPSSALRSRCSSSGVCSRAAPDSYCARGVGNFFGRLESQLGVPFEKCLWVPRGDSLGWQLKCGRRGDGARSALVTVQPDDNTGRSVGGIEKLVIAAEHGFQTKIETRGSSWALPALSYFGGARVEHESSSRNTFIYTRRASGWLLGKRASGKFGKMELFKPQLMDTVPFRFLSEYHTTPPRAGKDGVSPIFFFGFGQAKPPVVEVVQAGDPVLHEPAAEVRAEEIGSARVEKIINDMVATMRNAPGVGLAAPQIGVPLQIIVLEDTKELMSYSSREECEAQQRFPFDLLVIINPKLKTKSGSGSAVFFEGCLSVDGYRAMVERDLDVEVTGLGRDGRPIHVEASGWKARILQHECDHLAGSLYVDTMLPKTFRTKENLRLPLPAGCPKPGVCKHSTKSLKL